MIIMDNLRRQPVIYAYYVLFSAQMSILQHIPLVLCVPPSLPVTFNHSVNPPFLKPTSLSRASSVKCSSWRCAISFGCEGKTDGQPPHLQE